MSAESDLYGRLRLTLLSGPRSARELSATLGVSQATFSRLAQSHNDDLLVVGRARATRYALRRRIESVEPVIPLYEIQPDCVTRLLAHLHPVGAEGFYVEPVALDIGAGFFRDLPYFLDGMRPTGFLGRLIPQQVPELGLPNDILRWSADQCVRYLVTQAWDQSGNLILGERAYQIYLQQALSPFESPGGDLGSHYEQLANAVLTGAPPGSSAAGEQPKFLARRSPDQKHVIVKFSPPRNHEVGRRVADLLVAEHVALETLCRHGASVTLSRIVEGATRRFLEVERFDRTETGRRGVISLAALDNEYVGDGAHGQWPRIVAALVRQGIVDEQYLPQVAFLSAFGELIGNSDMHGGNLSFLTRGTTVVALAPAYDMLPMVYMPQQGHLDHRPLVVRPPDPAVLTVWSRARAAAEEFYAHVATHPLISPEFSAIADANACALHAASTLAARLPRPTLG